METKDKIIGVLAGSLLLGILFTSGGQSVSLQPLNAVEITPLYASTGDVEVVIELKGDVQSISEIVEAFAVIYKYKDEVATNTPKGAKEMIPNPQTKNEFFYALIVKHIDEVWSAWNVKRNTEAGRQAGLEANRARGKLK